MLRSATWLVAGLFVSSSLVTIASAQGNSAAARQAARERISTRAASRITRQPNPRSLNRTRQDVARRTDRRPERPNRPEQADRRSGETLRRTPEFRGRENALRRQLATVDRLRDQALLTGDDALLDRANQLESQIQARYQRSEISPVEVSMPDTTTEIQSLPPVREFERGLGRETARQVRGLDPLPEQELGSPGFGRRTAAERRYLRGQEARGPWDAQYRPMDPISQPEVDPLPPMDTTGDLQVDPLPPMDDTTITP